MAKYRPKLTISILISNRPDTIPRCLDSLEPIRKAVPSELILIDTSKNESIHQMLLTYTDRVYEFEWCNDFAKARNEGIRRARGEWFLYLDDDEWFEDSDEIIRFFQSGQYKKYGTANILLRNFLSEDFTRYMDSWVSRLFRLEEDVMFVGKIHEYMQFFDERSIFLQTLAKHTGYIFDTPEKRRKHFERNAPLLLELVEEDPDNMRWQGQMVQEYHSVDEWEKNIEFCEKQLQKEKNLYHFMDYNHYSTLYAGWIEALMKLGRFEEALEVGRRALEDKNVIELLRAYVYSSFAECYEALEVWDKAQEYAERYLEAYRAFDPEVHSSQEQLGALLIQYTFEEQFLEAAENISLHARANQGDEAAAQAWNKKCILAEEYRALVELERQVAIGPGVYILEYYDTLKSYSEKRIYVHVLENGEIKDGQTLAADVCAALKIQNYIALESQDKVQALSCLKDVVEIYPYFVHGIGKFFHFYAEFEKQRAQKQKREMKELRDQVMEQVKSLLKTKQIASALQIVGQLKPMYPDDLDVAYLALECRIKSQN